MKTNGSISRTVSVLGYVSENSPVVTAGVTAAAASRSRRVVLWGNRCRGRVRRGTNR